MFARLSVIGSRRPHCKQFLVRAIATQLMPHAGIDILTQRWHWKRENDSGSEDSTDCTPTLTCSLRPHVSWCS